MKKNNSNSYRVDSYFISPKDNAWTECDTLCWNAKNLRNYANFLIRQEFFKNNKYLNFYFIQKKLQQENNECYRKLPAKISQTVLRELDQNWKSFFVTLKEYKKNKNKFKGLPKPPKYKDKIIGRQSVNFTYQMVSKNAMKKNLLKLTGLEEFFNIRTIENVDSDGVVTYHCYPNLKEVSNMMKFV